MPILAGNQLGQFVMRLGQAEKRNDLTDWEAKFVADLREKFESREDAEDLGCPVWNPTVNQWNTLGEIARG